MGVAERGGGAEQAAQWFNQVEAQAGQQFAAGRDQLSAATQELGHMWEQTILDGWRSSSRRAGS